MSESAIDRVRRLVRELPDAREKLAWGEPTFRAGAGKMFATFANAATHHGAGRDALWCAAPPGAQEGLVAAAPDRFFVPPYVGKDGWIGIDLAAVDDTELAIHLREAFRCVAAPRLRDALDND